MLTYIHTHDDARYSWGIALAFELLDIIHTIYLACMYTRIHAYIWLPCIRDALRASSFRMYIRIHACTHVFAYLASSLSQSTSRRRTSFEPMHIRIHASIHTYTHTYMHAFAYLASSLSQSTSRRRTSLSILFMSGI